MYFFSYRVEFIHEEVERSVARMQTVIELGRVARDRKTLPIKVILFAFPFLGLVCFVQAMKVTILSQRTEQSFLAQGLGQGTVFLGPFLCYD